MKCGDSWRPLALALRRTCCRLGWCAAQSTPLDDPDAPGMLGKVLDLAMDPLLHHLALRMRLSECLPPAGAHYQPSWNHSKTM